MIRKVYGTNFRSYAKIELEFGHHQVSVVCGDSQSDYADSNGTGKTTLMYLVLWTLFGKWPGMENADSCIRQPANKDCCGSLTIEKPDGIYTVARYRKHSEHGSNLFIHPPGGGKVISGDLKVMNERVEGLLGMNYDTFVRTMVYTGTEGTTFALMTDKEQKNLLDTIVPFDFSALHERAKEKLKIAADTATECAGVTKAVEQWQERNSQAMMDITLKRQQLSEQYDATALQEKIDTLTGHLDAYNKSLNEVYQTELELQPKVQAAYEAISAYKPTIAAFEEAKERWVNYGSAVKMLAEQEASRSRNLEGVDHDIEREKQRLETDKQGRSCHTCGQALGDEALQQVISSTEKELNRLGDQRLDLIKHYDHLQKDYLKRKTATGFDDESWAKYKTDYDAARRHMNELEAHHMDLTGQDQQMAHRIQSLRSQIEQGNKVMEELQAAQAPGAGGLSEIDKEIERLKDEGARLMEDHGASAENEAKWLEEKTLWEKMTGMLGGGKGSLQHFLFESLLPEMTATAQMCLSLFSKDELRVAFKSHKKKGSKVVEGFYVEASKGDNTKGYGDLSGGERRRIDFCIFLTLHLMAAKHLYHPGVLFLDEIADFMDDTGQQSVVGVLEFFCQQYGISCLLLTNKRELVASVAHGYRCTMADGISTLVSVQET